MDRCLINLNVIMHRFLWYKMNRGIKYHHPDFNSFPLTAHHPFLFIYFISHISCIRVSGNCLVLVQYFSVLLSGVSISHLSAPNRPKGLRAAASHSHLSAPFRQTRFVVLQTVWSDLAIYTHCNKAIIGSVASDGNLIVCGPEKKEEKPSKMLQELDTDL